MIKKIADKEKIPQEDIVSIEINITYAQKKLHSFIYIKEKYRHLFPEPWTKFQIEDPYENKTYIVYLESYYRIPGLVGLFNKYQFLTEGYEFYLEVVEDKKKYRIRFDNLDQIKLDNKSIPIDEESGDAFTDLELLTYNTDNYSNITVKEGQRTLYLHYKIERNKKIVNLAKALALKNNKELRCEVCGFSFFEHYGDRGKNFIEGHHVNPLGLVDESVETKIEDIRLLCSNCHSMIHIKYPWLTIEELKNVYLSK